MLYIPLSAPDVGEAEIAAVAAVLRTPQLSLGPELEAFEKAMAAYIGARHAVGVNSGTSGLHLCMLAFGIQEGDEVIVPSFTFIAAANAIRMVRATPVFVDIDPVSLNLDPEQVEAAITARTKAILVVHTFGRPAEMWKLLELARRHKLLVLEDACEAIGAEYQGQKVGVLGDAGVFAFYPNKQITTGEGGVIVTNRLHVAEVARSLRNQGRTSSGDWFDHAQVGYNYRLPEMSCALGRVQLQRLESILARRAEIAGSYHARLSGRQDLILPALTVPNGRISWFVYVVRLSERFHREHRDEVIHMLAEQGIQCGRYFAPIHMQPAYSDWTDFSGKLPVTEAVAERCIALPFFNKISSAEVERVCASLEHAMQIFQPGEHF